jgi:hypothetical protein
MTLATENLVTAATGAIGARDFDFWMGEWKIHNRRLPVVGAFAGDTGVFEGADSFEGRPIRVRFIWSRTASGTPRWEQAFSADGGKTWETNWIMTFDAP